MRKKIPQRFDDIAESALATKKLRRQYRWARVKATWERIVGSALATRTTLITLKRGVLEVSADTAEVLAILHEKHSDIEARLSEKLGKDITLKLKEN